MIWLDACLPVLISLGTYAQAGSWSSAAAEIETPAEDTTGTTCLFSDRLDVPDDPDVSYTVLKFCFPPEAKTYMTQGLFSVCISHDYSFPSRIL